MNRFTFTALAFMLSSPAFSAEPEPTPSPSMSPSSSPSPKPSPSSKGAAIFAYSRTLPPTQELRNSDRDLSITGGSVSDLSLSIAERRSSILIGLGMGYSWIGRLERGDQPLPHSPDHWFFQAQVDWAPPIFSMLYFGSAFRVVPKWAVSKPIGDPEQERFHSLGGMGGELYAGLELPYGIFGQLGYRYQFLSFEERKLESLGGGSLGNFSVGYNSLVLTVGFRPERL